VHVRAAVQIPGGVVGLGRARARVPSGNCSVWQLLARGGCQSAVAFPRNDWGNACAAGAAVDLRRGRQRLSISAKRRDAHRRGMGDVQ
jgi:hypothetical protein